MTRKAILLSASPPPTQIPGIESDAEAWHHFLRSNPGGAWANQEITRLSNCDREAALAAVRAAKDTDYSLIVFAGQGQIRKGDLPWPEAHVVLGDGCSLLESELNPGTPRCTLVFDWSNREGAVSAASSKDAIPPQAEQGAANFRALFDQAIETAEGGLVKIFATEAGTTPNPAPSFSQQLLHAAYQWSRTNHGILPLQQAISLAAEAIQKTNPLLKPEYQGGRRLHHFPLAVST
jgi:hypothetical protein